MTSLSSTRTFEVWQASDFKKVPADCYQLRPSVFGRSETFIYASRLKETMRRKRLVLRQLMNIRSFTSLREASSLGFIIHEDQKAASLS